MRIHRLHHRQFIPLSPAAAWSYFSTPVNLEEITPSFLNFHITSEVPESIYNGLIITYRIAAVAGIPMTWVTEIKQLIPERQFVDEQRIGPFRFWHHLHRFEPCDGGVIMEDIVHYVMPWGWLGEWLHWIFIRRRLEAIFSFRFSYIYEKFACSHVKSYV